MKVLILVWLLLVGMACGSFACCRAWRIRKDLKEKRSVCINCGYRLKWYDNIPVLSWIFLRGRCRKCGKFIGFAEVLSEMAMGAAFLGIGFVFFMEAGKYGLLKFSTDGWSVATSQPGLLALLMFRYMVLLALVTVMWVLVIYDAKWKEMPTRTLVVSNILAMTYLMSSVIFLGIFKNNFSFDGLFKDILINLGIGVGVLPGIYYLLYFFSKEKLVGSGDWILALAIAITLCDFKLALVELFLSNLLALVVLAPISILKKQRQIPFGPFLVITFLLIFIFQQAFVA